MEMGSGCRRTGAHFFCARLSDVLLLVTGRRLTTGRAYVALAQTKWQPQWRFDRADRLPTQFIRCWANFPA
jgi:hypothetical protein